MSHSARAVRAPLGWTSLYRCVTAAQLRPLPRRRRDAIGSRACARAIRSFCREAAEAGFPSSFTPSAGEATGREDRRHQVDVGGDAIDLAPAGDFSRPANKRRHADAAFVNRALAPAKPPLYRLPDGPLSDRKMTSVSSARRRCSSAASTRPTFASTFSSSRRASRSAHRVPRRGRAHELIRHLQRLVRGVEREINEERRRAGVDKPMAASVKTSLQ